LDTAATFNKAQGRTMRKVNCVLNHPAKTPFISYEHIFVWLSRVRKGNDAKIMPFTNGYEHLRRLRPAKELVIYMNAINDHGYFDVQMATTAMIALTEVDTKHDAENPKKAKGDQGASRGRGRGRGQVGSLDSGRGEAAESDWSGRRGGLRGGRSQYRRGGLGSASILTSRGSDNRVGSSDFILATDTGQITGEAGRDGSVGGDGGGGGVGGQDDTVFAESSRSFDTRSDIYLLKNLGVSCYANVIVQLFRHIPVSIIVVLSFHLINILQ
jgi:hypothetical protein